LPDPEKVFHHPIAAHVSALKKIKAVPTVRGTWERIQSTPFVHRGSEVRPDREHIKVVLILRINAALFSHRPRRLVRLSLVKVEWDAVCSEFDVTGGIRIRIRINGVDDGLSVSVELGGAEVGGGVEGATVAGAVVEGVSPVY